MNQICHDCNKDMEFVQEERVIGLDHQWSTFKIYVCWNCKRIRIDKS